MVHDVGIVDDGLGGDQVVLLVVRQPEVEAVVARPFGRYQGAREADGEVQHVCQQTHASTDHDCLNTLNTSAKQTSALIMTLSTR